MNSKIQLAVIVLAVYAVVLGTASIFDSSNSGLSQITGLDVGTFGDFPPEVGNVFLNSTRGLNRTNENLTAHFNATDDDLPTEGVKNITDWRLNGHSIAVLNMPFENHTNSLTNATDYSSHNNNGTVDRAVFNNSLGFDGRGAYRFDGVNSSINVSSSGSLDTPDAITVIAWVNPSSFNENGSSIITKGTAWGLRFNNGTSSANVSFFATGVIQTNS